MSAPPEVPLTLEIAPPGCSSGLLLRDADLPPVQLERSRWITGVCVSGGHTGFSSLHWWKQDFGHPQSTPAPAYATPTQVGTASGIYVGCEVQETSYVISSSCDLRSVCAGLHPCLACAFFPRVISRAPGLKLVVETLITSLRPIGNIVLICCAFFIVFGILGVQVRSHTR